jgi:exosortase
MVPLPYMLHTGMSSQLQILATGWSTFTLQTIGLPAVPEGTIIKIGEAQVNVAEACSGLGMIVTFVALSVAAMILITSAWWVKAGLLLGAIPISLICNTIRISIVAMFSHFGHYSRDEIATIDSRIGLLMILVGCALIFVELYVLDRIVVAQDTSQEGDVPIPLHTASA